MLKMLRIILFPISVLYGVVMALRNMFFSKGIFKAESFAVPVISIGNITVGGTGKTPHTEYLINLLKEKYAIAILSRGYGRKTKGFVEVRGDSSPEECGDEPCQMKQKFPDQTVIVDENRREGIHRILQSYKSEVIVLDDAYQHRWVKPGLSLLLVDYTRPIYKDFIMPTGELREFPAGSQRADVVIVTKCPATISADEKADFQRKLKLGEGQQLFFSTFVYAGAKALFSDKEKESFEGMDVLLLTGIANPKPLKVHLEQHGARVTSFSFPDHYQFSAKDMDAVLSRFEALPPEKRCIVTTEKDSVRLKSGMLVPQLIKDSIYAIPIAVELLEDENELHQIIENYVTKN